MWLTGKQDNGQHSSKSNILNSSWLTEGNIKVEVQYMGKPDDENRIKYSTPGHSSDGRVHTEKGAVCPGRAIVTKQAQAMLAMSRTAQLTSGWLLPRIPVCDVNLNVRIGHTQKRNVRLLCAGEGLTKKTCLYHTLRTCHDEAHKKRKCGLSR
jgi:hypothetical protein